MVNSKPRTAVCVVTAPNYPIVMSIPIDPAGQVTLDSIQPIVPRYVLGNAPTGGASADVLLDLLNRLVAHLDLALSASAAANRQAMKVSGPPNTRKA